MASSFAPRMTAVGICILSYLCTYSPACFTELTATIRPWEARGGHNRRLPREALCPTHPFRYIVGRLMTISVSAFTYDDKRTLDGLVVRWVGGRIF